MGKPKGPPIGTAPSQSELEKQAEAKRLQLKKAGVDALWGLKGTTNDWKSMFTAYGSGLYIPAKDSGNGK